MSRRNIPMTEITEILYQWMQNTSQRKIVKLTGTSRNTVRKIIHQAIELGLIPGKTDDEQLLAMSAVIKDWLTSATKLSSGTAQHQLEQQHEQIKQWLDEPHMTVRQIGRLLKELTPSVTTSETSLHRYLKKHFPKPIESTTVLHTLPGEQGQVDFGYAGTINDPSTGKQRRIHAFVMTLSYSRYRFVHFVYKQDIATWIDCHVRAFTFFGGVPKTILLDNLKAGVNKPDIYDPVINLSYAECARYYSFIADPAKVRTPTHKGKVERSIQIIRQQILAGRSFDNIGKLNDYAHHWCGNIIANEITRTTGETPKQRFARDEQSKLLPLPNVPYEYATWQEVKVGRDQHVTFKGSFYSMPIKYVGETVTIKATQHMLSIYYLGKQIKAHKRLLGKGKWSTDNGDISERAKHYLDNTPDVCLEKAKAIGPATHSMLGTLLSTPTTCRLRKAQAILRLADRYTQARLESVCVHALQFGNTSVDALKRIITHDLDKKSVEGQSNMSTEELSQGAFLRNPNEFIIH